MRGDKSLGLRGLTGEANACKHKIFDVHDGMLGAEMQKTHHTAPENAPACKTDLFQCTCGNTYNNSIL